MRHSGTAMSSKALPSSTAALSRVLAAAPRLRERPGHREMVAAVDAMALGERATTPTPGKPFALVVQAGTATGKTAW